MNTSKECGFMLTLTGGASGLCSPPVAFLSSFRLLVFTSSVTPPWNLASGGPGSPHGRSTDPADCVGPGALKQTQEALEAAPVHHEDYLVYLEPGHPDVCDLCLETEVH